jgi:hypothetical protein
VVGRSPKQKPQGSPIRGSAAISRRFPGVASRESLTQAREAAEEVRKLLRAGLDPVDEGRARRERVRAAEAKEWLPLWLFVLALCGRHRPILDLLPSLLYRGRQLVHVL